MEGDPDARHYLLAAANHFRYLFRKPSDLKEANGKPVWIAHRFAILDCQVALENGTEPALSARDHLIFSPSSVSDPFHLPSPAMLQDYTSDSTPAYVMISQYAIRYFFLVAHSLATQFSFPDHADVEMIQWAWEKLDFYDSWIQATLSVFRSLEMSVSLQALTLSTMMWIYNLYHVLESAILDHLRSTLETLALEDELLTDSTAFETMSKFALLFAESMTRYEGCVCRLVRTTRNPDSVVQLTGFASSTRRLNTLATTFCASSVSDETLFPLGRLNKLASAAYLLEALEFAQTKYPARSLLRSISLVSKVQSELEEETGYMGKEAIHLLLPLTARTESSGSQSISQTSLPKLTSALYDGTLESTLAE